MTFAVSRVIIGQSPIPGTRGSVCRYFAGSLNSSQKEAEFLRETQALLNLLLAGMGSLSSSPLAACEAYSRTLCTAAPLLNNTGPYADERCWMPSKRLPGRTNVAPVGRRVPPRIEPPGESWSWRFEAKVGC